MKNFGGNITEKILLNLNKNFKSKIYFYKFIELKKNKKIFLGKNKNFTIKFLDKENVFIKFNKKEMKLRNKIIHGNNITVELFSKKNNKILYCGVSCALNSPKKISITPETEIYKVSKPWGHELWINSKSKKYSFKEIFIKKGYKTSLQYHLKKIETNLLYEGICKLHYSTINLEKFNPKYIKEKKMYSCTSIFVKPKTIHRIEALTDIKLYEVSTAQLSDVVRLQDDSKRPSGKIKTEHKNN